MALVEPEFAPDGMPPEVMQAQMMPVQQEIPQELQLLGVLAAHHNISEEFAEERLSLISRDVLAEYDLDKRSMKGWFERMQKGLDLANLIRKDKTAPWTNAANVKFPLVTSAALQFNARAYPAIVPGGEPVLAKTFGNDPGGQKAAKGKRIASHMSYQLTTEIDEWEGETDALLTVLPIVGTMLRKVWYDPAAGRTRVKLCDAGSVIVNDKVKSLDAAPRISEELKLYPYEIRERQLSGVFRKVDLVDDGGEDPDAAQMFIEQHRRIDLDKDGYPEPYIVTVHKASQKVVRIVANFELEDVVFNGRVLSIPRRDYYAVYHFLPSMDGGFWGTGLGMLLGDISESINSIINMLLDSGHLSSLGAGFIGAQSFRMKGGAHRVKPGEWKQVNARGGDIRESMVPLTFPQPSPVLFQMLGLLIEAGREIASVKDVLTGDANRQMTATTTLALIEQGQMVFTAAYKRIFRALKSEFKMIARINSETLSDEDYNAFHDGVDEEGNPTLFSAKQDYDLRNMDIAPVADPRVVTSMQAMGRAQLLMEMSQTGAVDQQAAAQRVLETAQIDDVEALVPKPNPVQEQLQQAQIEHGLFMMQAEQAMMEADIGVKMATIDEKKANAVKDMEGIDTDRMRLMLDQSKTRLSGLLELIKDDRRGSGAMAGKSGNGPAFEQPSPLGGAAQVPDVGILLGGQPAGPGGYGAGQG
jgi:chaperonin GroES